DDPATAAVFLPEIERVLEAVREGREPPSAAVDELEARLGWYGRLAGSLGDPAALDAMRAEAGRTVVVLFALLGGAGLVGLLGFVGLVVLLVFALTGRLADRIRPTSHHGVYAETFAIWLPSLLLLQFVVALVAPPSLVVLASAVAFFASLLVLAWPVVRGVPWRTVRADIGLPAVRFRDVPLGIAGYAMSLPLLAVGLLLTLLLILLATLFSGESPSPSHPAQQALVGGGAWQAVQIFVLATIAAPIVEEIMFRGVLFSHLRGAMRGWHASAGIAVAALISSVIFAAIHPQGLVFIPALAGLGVGFCLCREWTGSLVPAMVAHAVSNGLVLSLSLFLFAS
ncbi:MAG: type II CAAX endopeptidase family protein, partial [Planctomycetota bacterium]|nr:type II CAAX endopeptidase family protein [Planctomycetota bacterium]